jgi:hypothetical protein
VSVRRRLKALVLAALMAAAAAAFIITCMSSSELTYLVNYFIAYLHGPRADGTTAIQVAPPRPVIPKLWKLLHVPSAHAAGGCRLVGPFRKDRLRLTAVALSSSKQAAGFFIEDATQRRGSHRKCAVSEVRL